MLNKDPLEMYRTATTRASALMETVRPDQLGAPTPCSEWNVQQLIDHLVEGTEKLLAWVEGCEPAPVTGTTPADFRNGVKRVLEALRQPGAMERTCRNPLGDEWPVSRMVAGTSMDVLIHTWDLARATGQDERLDPMVVDACIAMFLPDIMNRGREAGVFGPEVAVGDDASPQDRLLAAAGRRP